MPSSLRGRRKKGGGGGEGKKNAKGIGKDPCSPLPSSPSLSTPTTQGTALSELWTLHPFFSCLTQIISWICSNHVRILFWEACL